MYHVNSCWASRNKSWSTRKQSFGFFTILASPFMISLSSCVWVSFWSPNRAFLRYSYARSNWSFPSFFSQSERKFLILIFLTVGPNACALESSNKVWLFTRVYRRKKRRFQYIYKYVLDSKMLELNTTKDIPYLGWVNGACFLFQCPLQCKTISIPGFPKIDVFLHISNCIGQLTRSEAPENKTWQFHS